MVTRSDLAIKITPSAKSLLRTKVHAALVETAYTEL